MTIDGFEDIILYSNQSFFTAMVSFSLGKVLLSLMYQQYNKRNNKSKDIKTSIFLYLQIYLHRNVLFAKRLISRAII